MARPQYDVESLINNIKRRCSVPTSQLTFTNTDFADLANDEMQTEIIPLVMSTREEYFVTHVDVNTDSDGTVLFPADAVGAKLRSVCYVQQTSPLLLINLPRIDLDVVAGVGIANYQNFAGFYIEGNELKLYPNTSVPAGTRIRLYYYKRTLDLIDPSNYGQVISVDPNSNTIVVDFVPAAWKVNTSLNSVSSIPNFAITNKSTSIVTLSSPSIILSSVEGISIGDYICEEGFSAIPQIPVEAHAYLAQLTAVKVLESLGDANGMQVAQAKADKLKDALLVVISNRVDGSPKKVVNPDGGLRIGSGIRRFWRF